MIEKRTRKINAKLKPSEDELFRLAASARGLTVSQAIREALDA
jgi:uncharacterized protein (DUF1778 family)